MKQADITAAALRLASTLWDMVKLLLLHPVQFFDSIDLDGRWFEPFLFLLPCILFNALMNTWLGASLLNNVARMDPEAAVLMKDLGAGFFLQTFLILSAAMIIGTFMMSFAISVALHFLGGKGSFQATYRVLACSWIILLVTWIPFFGFIVGLYFFVPAIIGLARAHSISRWRAFFGICIGPLAFIVVSSICFFVLANVAGFFIHPPGSNSPWNQDSELMRRYQSK